MKKSNQRESASHPAHPIRNFFYVLWSLLNAAAFVLGFFLLVCEPCPYGTLLMLLCAVTVLVALVFGVIRPLVRGK